MLALAQAPGPCGGRAGTSRSRPTRRSGRATSPRSMESDEEPIDSAGLIGDMHGVAPDDMMITGTGNLETWVEPYWDAPTSRAALRPAARPAWASAPVASSASSSARPSGRRVRQQRRQLRHVPARRRDRGRVRHPGYLDAAQRYTIGVIRDLERFYWATARSDRNFRKQSTGELWNPDLARWRGHGRSRSRSTTPAASASIRGCAQLRRPGGARRADEQRHRGAADQRVLFPPIVQAGRPSDGG